MASILAIREALADRLRTIDGLDVRTSSVGNAIVPAAIIQTALGGTVIAYDADMDRSVDINLTVTVLVGTVLTDAAEEKLEGFISATGPNSIKAAVDGDPTLGDLVQYAVATEVRNYGLVNYSASDYAGAELLVQVRAQ